MNQLKDPFEAAYEEQEDSPPDSPIAAEDLDAGGPSSPHPPPAAPGSQGAVAADEDDDVANADPRLADPSSSAPSSSAARNRAKIKEDEDDEEEDNMDIELAKLPSAADPDKMAKMQTILSQFTEDQMSRYESFRRSALQKPNMKRLLVSITGTQKITLPVNIVVCGIAKMFVGEVVETAKIVMAERKDSGPIRPCHIREAYRRLKLEGKIPKRSVPRLFR
ncbi:Transcription initiation factor TFIID subunit 11 [Linum perenne]